VTVNGELVVLTLWFPNAAGDGDMLITGVTPVPVRRSCALTVPFTVRMPFKAPVVDGVNVRLIVQVPLAAIVPPLAHVPVPALAKDVELGPDNVK